MLGKLANSNEPRKKMKNFKELRNEIDTKKLLELTEILWIRGLKRQTLPKEERVY